MGFSRKQCEAWARDAAISRGDVTAPPVKNRARVGTGSLAVYKRWLAEMACEPGLFLPMRTYSEANIRDKWEVETRKAEQRTAVAACGRGYILPFVGKATLVVTLTRYAPRTFDEGDNLAISFKAIRDEISRLVGIDDRHADQIRFVYDQKKTHVRCYGVRIEIEATGEVKHGVQ